MTEVLGPLAADYLSRIERRDRVGALRLARETADQDGPPRVIVEMLAPAQVEVGRRWEAAEWTVATEHEATAITETAVARLPDVGPADREGGVVVACVEQEWHSLPARMLGELMRFHGWDVVFLGASTPVVDLNRFLGGSHPVAVALSCSVAAHLPGALRSIDAADANDIPVIAGGRGFGEDARVALRLGADAWARTAEQAAAVLEGWANTPPRELRSPAVNQRTWSALESRRGPLVTAALQVLMSTLPWLSRASERQLHHTREDLDWILRFLNAAVLVDDPRVFTEFATWLDRVLTARKLPPDTARAGFSAIDRALRRDPGPMEAIRMIGAAL